MNLSERILETTLGRACEILERLDQEAYVELMKRRERSLAVRVNGKEVSLRGEGLTVERVREILAQNPERVTELDENRRVLHCS